MPVPQLNQVQGSGQLPILQTSTFRVLPSELVLEIFSHLDIITVFRFLDTCRYHRYLLINMPDIWRKVRFVPLSEYSAMSSSTSSTPLSIAAAAPIANSNELVAHSASASSSNPPVRLYQKRAQRTLQPRDSSSRSGSDSEGSNESTSKVAESAANRIKHGENERDRDRGGSQSLISEIYAVLRRFRKENQLVNYVREIYMDSTDSPHFPSPLVMLIKFPHLQVLSSRYRRKQTSLTTDAHILKDMLRNGDIMPHSLELRRWDIFHPFMTKEDVTGFKQVLDAIAAIGEGMPGQEKFKNQDGETTLTTAHRVEDSPGRSSPVAPTGVLLDIRLCPGPLSVSSDDISPVAAGDGGAEPQAPSTTGFGGAFHWAVPSSAPTIPSTSSQSTAVLPGPPQPCGNIVWVLEKCRVCDAPQERCWKCVEKCNACNAIRVSPSINHQTALERQRSKQYSTGVSVAVNTASESEQISLGSSRRPLTPPGSISLSQMRNPLQGIRSAYISHPHMAHTSSSPSLFSPSSSAMFSSTAHASQPVPTVLTRPPEFSLFD